MKDGSRRLSREGIYVASPSYLKTSFTMATPLKTCKLSSYNLEKNFPTNINCRLTVFRVTIAFKPLLPLGATIQPRHRTTLASQDHSYLRSRNFSNISPLAFLFDTRGQRLIAEKRSDTCEQRAFDHLRALQPRSLPPVISPI